MKLNRVDRGAYMLDGCVKHSMLAGSGSAVPSGLLVSLEVGVALCLVLRASCFVPSAECLVELSNALKSKGDSGW